MNNSSLCWLRRAPPLLAPHALFVVLFSHPDRNEFWLRLDFTRCCIYFYILCHCSGKISPPSDKQNLEKWLKMDLL